MEHTTQRTHDSFGWLKTTLLVIALFSAGLVSAVAAAKADPVCASACRAKHDQCRLATKGQSAGCDQQLNACVSACFAAKK
jgi:hypothetical protein